MEAHLVEQGGAGLRMLNGMREEKGVMVRDWADGRGGKYGGAWLDG